MTLFEYFDRYVANWHRPFLDPKSFERLKYTTPLSPTKYLEFAEKDLRGGGPRGLVNALANAKRAIDCEIHNLLRALGLPEPRSFPERLNLIGQLGLLAPRVVRKVAQLRNVLEHEFYLPSKTEVEDAVDIASLFVGGLKPYHVGGLYMTSSWLADELSANPHGEVIRTKTHTTWQHSAMPRYTYSRGIFIERLPDNRIMLECIHDNAAVLSHSLGRKDKGYLELQSFLLRCEVESLTHTRRGASSLLKVVRAAA